jgi:hypothetical protein
VFNFVREKLSKGSKLFEHDFSFGKFGKRNSFRGKNENTTKTESF